MMQSSKKQVLNSDKNTEIKDTKDDKMFIGCIGGNLLEFSLIDNTIVYDFGEILSDDIISMAKTFDKKS